MADTKLSALTEMGENPAIDDIIYLVDITAGTTGDRKIETRYWAQTNGTVAYINNGGTLNLGGYSFVVPATGTAVTLDATQTLSSKTLGTPTITGGTINTVVMGTPNITGGTADSIALNNTTIGTPTITGGTMGTATITGGTISGATISGTIENATFGTPTIIGGTMGTATITGGTVDGAVLSGVSGPLIIGSGSPAAGTTGASCGLYVHGGGGGWALWTLDDHVGGSGYFEAISDGTEDVTTRVWMQPYAVGDGNAGDPTIYDTEKELTPGGGTVEWGSAGDTLLRGSCNADGSMHIAATGGGTVNGTILLRWL